MAITALTVFACAEKQDIVSDQYWDDSFEAWIKNNDPHAEKIQNVYMRFIEQYPQAPPYLFIPGSSYILINYTGRTLGGDIFVTRSDSISRMLGTFDTFTHYGDQFTMVEGNTGFFASGVLEALYNMKVGDSARVYIPARNAYVNSVNFEEGYKGATSNFVNLPIMYDIRLKYISNDPLTYEGDSLANFARHKWGMEPKDTLKIGIYMRKTKENPEGDVITEDSTAFVFWSQHFLDGFLMATNIDTLAQQRGIYVEEQTNRYSVLTLQPFKGSSVPSAVSEAVINMRKGEEAEIAVVSAFGAGNAGALGSETGPYVVSVDPYTPSYFFVKALTKEELDALYD